MRTDINWKWSTPINFKKIDLVEQKLGLKFPMDYRNFVVHNNGGFPSKKNFDMPFKKGLILNNLINLQEGENSPSILETIASMHEIMPKKLIPIGVSPFGDLICLNYNFGVPKIYYMFHELDNDRKTRVEFIADSFEQFINILK
jgi:hypothetical protein